MANLEIKRRIIGRGIFQRYITDDEQGTRNLLSDNQIEENLQVENEEIILDDEGVEE